MVTFPRVSLPNPCMHRSCPPAVPHVPTISFSLITRIIFGQYRPYGSTICSLLPAPVILPALDPNIFLSTLFLSTLGLCSSLSGGDHVSHPHKRQNYSSVNFGLYIFVHQTVNVVCCQVERSLGRADPSSRGALPNAISQPQKSGGLGPNRAVVA